MDQDCEIAEQLKSRGYREEGFPLVNGKKMEEGEGKAEGGNRSLGGQSFESARVSWPLRLLLGSREEGS